MKRRKKDHILPFAKARTKGKVGALGERCLEALHFSKTLRARSTCLILPPHERIGLGRHLVVEHKHGVSLICEGVVLRQPGQAVVISHRDCPVVVLVDRKTGVVGVAHAGRDSLINYLSECQSCGQGVLPRLISTMGIPHGEDLLVKVIAGISAKHFPQTPEIAQAFIKRFGAKVIRDKERRTLDLMRVIRITLKAYGVPPENITSDGLCTVDTPWLGSLRAESMGIGDKENSNWTWVGKTD